MSVAAAQLGTQDDLAIAEAGLSKKFDSITTLETVALTPSAKEISNLRAHCEADLEHSCCLAYVW